MRFRFVAIGVLCALPGLAQQLTVKGLDGRTIALTAADLAHMPRTMIDVTEHGHDRKFEGVLLREVLAKIGAPQGEKVKGQNVSAIILATGHDGYRATVALAEADEGFQENQILIADSMNGTPLPEQQGPFRLITPEDKRPARWVRMLETIELKIP